MKKILFILNILLCLFVLSQPVYTHEESKSITPNVLFIHHSVGHSLIRDGSVRQILTEAGYEFWDHGYNDRVTGLINGEGKTAGCYWIPDNNTNPDGFANLFSLNPGSDNTLNKILKNHDITLFKSCFPASKIEDDKRSKDIYNPGRRSVYNYKKHYLKIRQSIDKYPEKIFIIVTQPPLHPNSTSKDEANRARAFANWLTSKEYLGKRKNIFVFDFFNLLADPKTNMLRKEYQIDPNSKNSILIRSQTYLSPRKNLLISLLTFININQIQIYRKLRLVVRNGHTI